MLRCLARSKTRSLGCLAAAGAAPASGRNARPDHPRSLRTGAEAVTAAASSVAADRAPEGATTDLAAAVFVTGWGSPPIVAARDGDPRTPAEAIARSPRRARARRRTTRRAAGGDAPAAATPATTGGRRPGGRRAERAGRAQGRGRRRAAAATEARPAVRRGGEVAAEDPVLGDGSALSLLPIWLFMYVRSVTEAPEVATGPLGVGAEEYSQLRQLPRRERRGRRRPPVRRRRGRSRRSRTSRTSCASSTSARPTTTSPASPATATRTARAARTRPARSARCPPRARSPAATSPTPRSSPSSATSATRSAAPTRRQRRVRRGVRGLVLRGVADLRRPGGRHDAAPTLADAGLTNADGRADRDHPDRRRAGRGLAPRVTTTAGSTDAGPSASTITTDVLVVGGGPAGAAAAYWLARHGHDVTVVEKKTFPREKTCGDGLTPRAVKQLDDMGLGQRARAVPPLPGPAGDRHGPRARAGVAGAPDLPAARLRRAPTRARPASSPPTPSAAGATLLQGHEAVHPLVERGFVRGAPVQRADGSTADVRAEFTIVADGANSRFGRALGTFRTREWPYGTAIRTYWQSPKHAEPWIESALDVKDRNGNPMPGLRLDLPGRRRHREHRRRAAVDVPRLQERQHHPPARRLRPPDRRPLGDRRRPPRGPPVSGRIPMGGSVGPEGRRRPTSSSATPPAASTRSTARASTTPTRRPGWPPTSSTRRSIDADADRPAALPEAARRRVRPVLQGRPPVRPRHRAAGADARADPGRDAQPHADGVGAADHGQPAAPRRDRPGRGRLQGGAAIVRLPRDSCARLAGPDTLDVHGPFRRAPPSDDGDDATRSCGSGATCASPTTTPWPRRSPTPATAAAR